MKSNRKLLLPFLLTLVFFSFSMQAQNPEAWKDSVVANFSRQLELFPHEKVYAHLDRYHYLSNDTIWFSLYLLDAATHRPLETEQIIYAELINGADSVVNRVKIAPDAKNRYYGYLPISDEYGNGHFTFRAYAPYMYNSGEESFFTRPLIIGGVSPGEGVPADYEVQFFPEGGNLLDETMCYVGFKALNSEGMGEPVTGEVVDEEGTVVTTFGANRLGMGMFSLTAVAGKNYFARCRIAGKAETEYQLPQAITHGYGLQAKWANNRLIISVRTPNKQTEKEPLYLLMHCRGMVQDLVPWDYTKEFVAFEKALFPTGILHLVLLDRNGNIHSERLAFCRDEKSDLLVDFQTDKNEYESREQVTAKMILKDRKDQPLKGILSVSVTDDSNSYIDTTLMITSSLLLTSELRGNIETPEYYFSPGSRQATMDLDCLMLTQGWRRYDVASIAKGDFEQPEMEWDGGLFLSGTVMGGYKAAPLKDSNVTLYASTGDYFASTDTDDKGRFSFLLPTLPDSTLYRVQAKPSINYGQLGIIVDTPVYPKVNRQYKRRVNYSDYMDFQKLINLPDVSVIAKKREPKPASLSAYSRLSSQTFNSEYFDSSPTLSWEKIANGISGAQLLRSGPDLYISLGRAPGLSEGRLPARIMLDDVLLPGTSSLSDIDLYNVAQVDVIKGAQASIFGSEGMYGVISIITRQTNRKIPNEYIVKVVTLLGHQQPVEFYSPQYNIKEAMPKGQDLRKTIYWKPDLETNENGEANISFYSADLPTTYTVVVEGVDSDGNIVRHIDRIRSKAK